MRFEGRRRSRRTPGMTPIIDAVFLLLIFFMLTSHFVHEEAIDLELPEAKTGRTGEDLLQVHLDGQDRILFADQEIQSAGELEELLSSELAQSENKVIRVRGDRSASLEKTVMIMDAARAAGAAGVDIVTRSP